MVQDIVPGGTFLLNCIWSPEELDKQLPAKMKKYIAENNINFYTINGIKIAEEVGLPGRASTILQSAFFTIANIIPVDKAIELMKKAVVKKFSKKGEAVVNANCNGIDRGSKEVVKIDVPESWKDAVDEEKEIVIPTNRPEMKDFVKNILQSLLTERTVYIRRALPHLKKEVLQLLFLNGTVQSVPSVTFVQWFALTL